MGNGWMFFAVILLAFVFLDAAMVVSLVRPGDEIRMMIVWKDSTYTLLATAGGLVLDVVQNMIHVREMTANPFVKLTSMALIYFALLVFFRKKHGG